MFAITPDLLNLCPAGKVGMIAGLCCLWSWNDDVALDREQFASKDAPVRRLVYLQGQYGTDFPLLMASSLMAIAPDIDVYHPPKQLLKALP